MPSKRQACKGAHRNRKRAMRSLPQQATAFRRWQKIAGTFVGAAKLWTKTVSILLNLQNPE
ncbi:MAG TPA: hypothetical protein VL996_13550 [Methylocella sp.]|nr:hypothetical protein [Methylocella sp.]